MKKVVSSGLLHFGEKTTMSFGKQDIFNRIDRLNHKYYHNTFFFFFLIQPNSLKKKFYIRFDVDVAHLNVEVVSPLKYISKRKRNEFECVCQVVMHSSLP